MPAVDELASRLLDAASRGRLIAPLTDDHPAMDLAAGYAVQDRLLELREAAGELLVGLKLGLTNRDLHRDMGSDEPLYGWLTDAMVLDVGTPLDVSNYGQPRVEPEIAFLLDKDLHGTGVTAAQVLAASSAVVPALDIVDSRYPNYAANLPDLVADNGSSARFVLGATAVPPHGIDLRTIGCTFERNGELVATAAGAAALGHPAAAVAWVVRHLAGRGRGIEAGMVVLSGALTSGVPVEAGDIIRASFDRLGTVKLECR